MIESMAECLLGLFFSALILLGGACILGASLAALRGSAVKARAECAEWKDVLAFGAAVTGLDDRMIE
jgi:hypothetical protein